jgi:hypothetical protein
MEDTRMSENDADLADMLGPEPDAVDAPSEEVLVDETPPPPSPRGPGKSRPMGAASKITLAKSRSYPVGGLPASKYGARKNSPERLKQLLSYIAEMPVSSAACMRGDISMSTLKYWLQKSKDGRPGDGFDIPLGANDETADDGGNLIRFHEAWDVAMEVGVGLVEEATIQRAKGYWEVLTYQGKVQYKMDPEKVDLALFLGDPVDERNSALWLRDRNGAPVPEQVWKMDPDLAMFILKTRKPGTYGAKSQVDINVKGGVLVVPMQAITSEDLNVIEGQYRVSEKALVTFEDDDEDAV